MTVTGKLAPGMIVAGAVVTWKRDALVPLRAKLMTVTADVPPLWRLTVACATGVDVPRTPSTTMLVAKATDPLCASPLLPLAPVPVPVPVPDPVLPVAVLIPVSVLPPGPVPVPVPVPVGPVLPLTDVSLLDPPCEPTDELAPPPCVESLPLEVPPPDCCVPVPVPVPVEVPVVVSVGLLALVLPQLMSSPTRTAAAGD